jgi:hypothetical protein
MAEELPPLSRIPVEFLLDHADPAGLRIGAYRVFDYDHDKFGNRRAFPALPGIAEAADEISRQRVWAAYESGTLAAARTIAMGSNLYRYMIWHGDRLYMVSRTGDLAVLAKGKTVDDCRLWVPLTAPSKPRRDRRPHPLTFTRVVGSLYFDGDTLCCDTTVKGETSFAYRYTPAGVTNAASAENEIMLGGMRYFTYNDRVYCNDDKILGYTPGDLDLFSSGNCVYCRHGDRLDAWTCGVHQYSAVIPGRPWSRDEEYPEQHSYAFLGNTVYIGGITADDHSVLVSVDPAGVVSANLASEFGRVESIAVTSFNLYYKVASAIIAHDTETNVRLGSLACERRDTIAATKRVLFVLRTRTVATREDATREEHSTTLLTY